MPFSNEVTPFKILIILNGKHSLRLLATVTQINVSYAAKYKGWTQWSVFSPCNEVCKKERQRYCYNSGNRKACGGKVNAYGVETQVVKCSKSECPGER